MTADTQALEAVSRGLYDMAPLDMVGWHNAPAALQERCRETASAALSALTKAGYAVVPREKVEAGRELLPLPARGGATATDVMITASGLLKAADLAVFELGMWQSWTGR